MVKIQKNILIGRSAEAIWLILADPVLSSGLNPNMKLLYCYESRLGGFDRVFRCRMGGKSFEARTEITAYICSEHMAYKTCGAFESAWYWWLESDGQQTHVSLTVDYEMPKVLAGLNQRALEAENARDIEAHLVNLKRAAEENA